MGSSKGWSSAFTGVANLLTGGYYGAKKVAKAQESAAAQYAAGQEKIAAAVESSNQIAPQAVQATNNSAQQAAEGQVQSAAKRRRTVQSTASSALAGGSLGNLGGRQTL